MAEGFIFNYFPTPVLWKNSGPQDFQGPSRWVRKPQDISPVILPCRKQTERPLEEERREEGDPVLVSTSTYCSTERVRLVAKASATDLAPLSLMALLWRLWRPGRSTSAAVPVSVSSGGLNLSCSVTEAQGMRRRDAGGGATECHVPLLPTTEDLGTAGSSQRGSGRRIPSGSQSMCLLMGNKVPLASR